MPKPKPDPGKCSLSEFLRGQGIRTTADMDSFIQTHRRAGESRYSVMCRQWGERNADIVMRRLEECSWQQDPLFAPENRVCARCREEFTPYSRRVRANGGAEFHQSCWSTR